MEFQEIDTTGKMWVQRLAAIPTWTTADKGRIIYNTANGYYYFGGASTWVIMTTGVNTNYISAIASDSHAGNITPTVNNTYNLGSATYKYANVYATNFQGISTSAKYADVAEKYILKEEYPVGTILKIELNDEEWEMLEISNNNDLVSGVISDKPGFVLNSESEGTPIALVGKTPVRVVGMISKGDMISPYENGCGIKTTNKIDMMAISLETNETMKEKLVMCLLKL